MVPNHLVLISLCLAGTVMAGDPALVIPSAGGPLTIDGTPNEEIWKQAAPLPLRDPAFGAPFPQGGAMRAVVRAGYLCLSARVPETGRLVARSTGVNPVWWREDLVVWTIRFKSYAVGLKLAVNPLGGYRADYMGAKGPPDGPVLAAATAGPDGWSIEAAIPLDNIAPIGILSAERIRAPRPDAPELRWQWPAAHEELTFTLARDGTPSQAPAVERKAWWAAAPEPPPLAPHDPFAVELGSLSPHLLAPDRQPDRMWESNLRSRVTTAALAERRAWEAVDSVAAWERFRDPRVAALKSSLGPFPTRTPLRATVSRRLDFGDGFALENVLFESRPGLVVAANLYLPSKIAGRIPAIVVVHSHHAPKVQSELQDIGMTWARSGTAVLVMDQLGAGERVQSQPWPHEGYYARYALGMQFHVAGESLIKWMAWDLMRGIDLLLERPYIDPRRIVMLGAVAGGGDPAAVTAVLDTRIAAALPFNFGEAGPEEHYTEGPRPYDAATADPGWGSWESTRGLRQSIAGQFFPWLICAAIAPRPFVFSFEVGWPAGVEKEPAWARYKKVYGLYGKSDRLAQVDGFGPFTGPGEVTNVGVDLRKKIYPVLKRWLDIPIPAEEYHNPRPDADLMCLTPQAAVLRKPQPASELALAIAQARLAAARAPRAGLVPADRLRRLRAALREKLGTIDPDANPPAHVLWTRPFAGFRAEAVELESAGVSVPLLLLQPAGASAKPSVVLAVGQGGKAAFLADRRGEIAALLQRGMAVCLADVRGTGETAARRSSASLAATELMLGQTVLGSRVRDARAVVRYLAGRGDLDAQRLAVWGDSFAAVNPPGPLLDQSINQQAGPQAIRQADPLGATVALLTALYEDGVRAVAARGGLVSYLSTLRDRFCYVPLDAIVPGMLEVADTADLVEALAPRGVLLARLVDGRNRGVTPAEANQEYRGAPSQLAIRKQADGADLAQWVGAQMSR